MPVHHSRNEGFRAFHPACVFSVVYRVHRTRDVQYEIDVLRAFVISREVRDDRRESESERNRGNREKRPPRNAEFFGNAVVSRRLGEAGDAENPVREKPQRPKYERSDDEDDAESRRHYTEGSSLTIRDVAVKRTSERSTAAKNGNCAEAYLFTLSRLLGFLVDWSSASKIASKPFASLALAKVQEVVVERNAMSSASTIALMGFPSGQRK